MNQVMNEHNHYEDYNDGNENMEYEQSGELDKTKDKYASPERSPDTSKQNQSKNTVSFNINNQSRQEEPNSSTSTDRVKQTKQLDPSVVSKIDEQVKTIKQVEELKKT